MRVAFFTNIIPHYRKSFYTKLSQLKDVDLLVVHGLQEEESGRPGLDEQEHFPFQTVCSKNYKKKVGPFLFRWQKGVKRALQNFSPEVVVILGISGTLSNWILGFLARRKKIKVLMWTCGWESQKQGSLAHFFKRVLMRFYYRIPHRMLVYSTKAQKYVERLGVETRKTEVCYNGIEIDELLKKEREIVREASLFRKKENVAERIVFLYVGAMLLEKKVDFLLEAFFHVNKKERQTHLWLVGDGPDLSYFKQKARELNLKNVHFWGQIIDDVSKFFAAADFFVLPGIGGLALNHAMFWKTPCICSEADGTEDDLIVNEIIGFRFEKDNIQSLVNTMLKAFYRKDMESSEEMIKKARELILTRSNVDKMVETFNRNLNLLRE